MHVNNLNASRKTTTITFLTVNCTNKYLSNKYWCLASAYVYTKVEAIAVVKIGI